MGEKVKNAVFTNWKTSAFGIGTAIIVMIQQLGAALDGNPATVPDWNTAIAGILIALGFISSKDHGL